MTLIPRQRMDALLPPQDGRIATLMLGGGRVWVKYGGKDYRNGFQRIIDRIGGFRHTLPPGRLRLYREVTHIRLLSRMGLCVPRVVAVGRDYIALSDIGETIETLLRPLPDAASRAPYLQAAASSLGILHRKGGWHGNAKLRNFTWDGRQAGMIDFEESGSIWPLFYKQAKDVFMLIGSMHKFDPDGALITLMLDSYRQQRCLMPLYVSACALLPLYLLLWPLRKVLGRDVRETVRTLGEIYSYMLGKW